DEVSLAESQLLPLPLAGGRIDAGQVRDGAGTADIVVAVEIAIQKYRRLPFVAKDAFGAVRTPYFVHIERPAVAILQAQQYRAVILAGGDEDVAADHQRRGDIAVEVGLVGIVPELGPGRRIETEASGTVEDDELLAAADFEECGR